MWVKAKEREKNKEKHVNGAMFLTETNKGDDWLEAIAISNYETMWLAHGSQVIDHMIRNKRKGETCLAGRILYAQARGKGMKNRNK
jgi:hypothetical protein